MKFEENNIPIDLNSILEELAKERQIFQVEADFQFSLAWLLRRKIDENKYDIRLEYCSPDNSNKRRQYIDIIVFDKSRKYYYPIELKYKTINKDEKSISIKNERFLLKNQGAQDLGCYAGIVDIMRIENLRDTEINGYKFNGGATIFITNDDYYYNRHSNGMLQNYWLDDGRKLSGKLEFSLNGKTKECTFLRNYDEITLQSKYKLEWKNYGSEIYGFKYLLINITKTEKCK